MEKTKIEWADSSWNPVTGCYHSCPYCYARVTANRFKGCDSGRHELNDGQHRIVELVEPLITTSESGRKRIAAYPFGFTPTLHKYRLGSIKKKTYGETVFVCSMADLFGEWVPDSWIKAVFDACREAPEHRYLFLTKNPKRYIELHNKGLLQSSENFWYGSTTTDSGTKFFLSKTYNTFLIMEPILGSMQLPDSAVWPTLKWVILGAETGKRAGKVVPKREWIENTVSMCRSRNVPVFMKDSLKEIWGEDIITEFPW